MPFRCWTNVPPSFGGAGSRDERHATFVRANGKKPRNDQGKLRSLFRLRANLQEVRNCDKDEEGRGGI